MEDDHTASFITALANLQPSVSGLGDATPQSVLSPSPNPITAEELATLDGWTADQLKAEVIRLRRALALRDLRELRGLRGLREDVDVDVDVDALEQQHHENTTTADAILQSHLAFAQPFSVTPVGTVTPTTGLPVPPAVSVPQVGDVDQVPQLAQASPAANIGEVGEVSQVPQVQVPVDPVPGPVTVGATPGPSRKRAATRRDDSEHPPKVTKRDEGTGKRVERGRRRVELGRAIRSKLRMAMNISMDDPLPPPSAVTAPDSQPGDGYWVPNWMAGVGDAANAQWLDRVCLTFIAEARAFQGWAKVPPEDLEEETVKTAARTAFMNFAKRYMAEVDPKHAKRKEKYVKNRRRWARKDLKQKRRSKAAQDPSFGEVLPASALHIDYMSSEYSSAGEDDPEEVSRVNDDETSLADQRRLHWLNVLRSQTPEPKSGKGGWADGVSEKVLEVRKPTWRSARLEDVYQRLDNISAAQAALRATPASQPPSSDGSPAPVKPAMRLGHVAPSHRRFTMPPPLMRRGRTPKDTGEAWMWASGQAGVWPASEREVVQAVDAVKAAAVEAAANAASEGGETDSVEGAVNVAGVNVDGVHVGGAVDLNVHDAVNLASVVESMEEDLDPSVDALVEGWTDVEG